MTGKVESKQTWVSRPDFLCLYPPPPPADGPRRIAPAEVYRWYCSLQFASAGLIIQWFCRQRGILGVQITHKLLDCDGNHCSSQTMSSLWCPWCLAGWGKFFFSFSRCLRKGNPINCGNPSTKTWRHLCTNSLRMFYSWPQICIFNSI